jgi:hypothetical protein
MFAKSLNKKLEIENELVHEHASLENSLEETSHHEGS